MKVCAFARNVGMDVCSSHLTLPTYRRNSVEGEAVESVASRKAARQLARTQATSWESLPVLASSMLKGAHSSRLS